MHGLDLSEIRRLRAEMLSYDKIAKKLGTNETAISRACRAMGLPHITNQTRTVTVDVPKLFQVWNDSSLSVTEAARKLGVSTGMLYRLARRYGLQERRRVNAAWKLDDPPVEEEVASAASLDFSPYVKARIKELGLGMPKEVSV